VALLAHNHLAEFPHHTLSMIFLTHNNMDIQLIVRNFTVSKDDVCLWLCTYYISCYDASNYKPVYNQTNPICYPGIVFGWAVKQFWNIRLNRSIKEWFFTLLCFDFTLWVMLLLCYAKNFIHCQTELLNIL